MPQTGKSDEPVPSMFYRHDRKRVLVCVSRYLPGFKSGGPIRAISNMIARLSAQFEFFVVTRDRDATDRQPFPGIEHNRWHRVGDAQVFYCASITSSVLLEALRDAKPDLIHLNSFSDTLTRVLLWLRRMGKLDDIPVLLAPRGEFSAGAMRIRRTKKRLYGTLTKLVGLYDNLHWQVSTPIEEEELLQASPARGLTSHSVHVVPEIFDAAVSSFHHPLKRAGTVTLAFISRMSEKKNLHFLLDVLMEVRGDVAINLFGPVADKDVPYWTLCQSYLHNLPANIKAQYLGPLHHAMVPQTLREHHFFVLPTKGENFCHAAVESILNGTPVILSDRTPWVNLSPARAGFDIPLTSRNEWIDALQRCVDMDQKTYSTYLDGTRDYSCRFSIENAVQEHLTTFRAVLGQVV